MRSAKPLLVTSLWHAGLMNTYIWLYVNIPGKEHVALPVLGPIHGSSLRPQCLPGWTIKSKVNECQTVTMCTLLIWKCQTLRRTLFWFCDNLKEMITHFVPSSADIPNLRACLSFSQFFFLCNASLIMLFYIVSSCPAVEFVLLKTLNRLRTFLSLLLVSYMKPNQYSTMLDWKLEAVSTRIYWFLPFSSLPSILTAQSLQLRLGFIHHRGCSCTRPHWAALWEEDKAWYIH